MISSRIRYNFAIIRAYQSNEQPDYNAPGSIAAAWAGGMSYVDVYMFPCAVSSPIFVFKRWIIDPLFNRPAETLKDR